MNAVRFLVALTCVGLALPRLADGLHDHDVGKPWMWDVGIAVLGLSLGLFLAMDSIRRL